MGKGYVRAFAMMAVLIVVSLIQFGIGHTTGGLYVFGAAFVALVVGLVLWLRSRSGHGAPK